MKIFSIIVLSILSILALVYFLYIRNLPTFRANIDGSEFKADRGGATYTSGRIQIAALHAAPETTKVMIAFSAIKVGTYSLNVGNAATNPELASFALYFVGKNVYACVDKYKGSVTITKLDLEEEKVSGTFSFQAVQVFPQGSKVVNVTNGTFEDIPLRYIGYTKSHQSDAK